MESRPKAPRQFTAADLQAAIAYHAGAVRRIQLWRRANRGRPGIWMHLGRFRPVQQTLSAIEDRFGGGVYRVKLLGPWLPEAQREEFLQQVTVSIAGEPTPRTARRLARLGYGVTRT